MQPALRLSHDTLICDVMVYDADELSQGAGAGGISMSCRSTAGTGLLLEAAPEAQGMQLCADLGCEGELRGQVVGLQAKLSRP